jgi:phosphoribosyl-AMP cyclohydrolase
VSYLDDIHFDQNGLVTAVAQDARTGQVLMVAWMNRESVRLSVETGFATYWSRSRQKLWKKGEESGHLQKLIALSLDCDGDTLLLKVEQIGGIACHTGRESCFFSRLDGDAWRIDTPVLKDPSTMYKPGT